MSYYAQFTNGIVTSVTETHSPLPDSPDLVQIDTLDESLLGCSYSNGAFVAPTVAAVRHLSRLAFRRRFSPAERVAIEIASLDDPAATMPERAQAAAIRSSQADILSADYVDLDDQDVIDGVQAFEAVTLLATGRAATILTATIQPGEKP